MIIDHAPRMYEFSSRGHSKSYLGILKLDIIAPRLLIVGGWILDNQGDHC